MTLTDEQRVRLDRRLRFTAAATQSNARKTDIARITSAGQQHMIDELTNTINDMKD